MTYYVHTCTCMCRCFHIFLVQEYLHVCLLSGESICEPDESERKCDIERFVGNIMTTVWTRSTQNLRQNVSAASAHHRQQPATGAPDSDADDDTNLFLFADDLVTNVLDDAVVRYRRQQREEHERLEAMWRRAQERFELDARYFNAEFGRFCDDVKPKSRSAARTTVNGHVLSDHELLRRRSLDELRKYERKTNGYHHGSQPTVAIKCREGNGLTLDSAAHGLTVDGASSKSPLLLVPGGRRASEPMATRRRGSFDVTLLHPHTHLLERRRSSQYSTSSREMILDWLQQQNQLRRYRMTSSRQRTTSSHLDWFAQDLLLEAFNDAFREMFGDALFFVDSSADDTSINQSFTSSLGCSDQCDVINVSVPQQALAYLDAHGSGWHGPATADSRLAAAATADEPDSPPRDAKPTQCDRMMFAGQLESKTKRSHAACSDSKSSNSDMNMRDVMTLDDDIPGAHDDVRVTLPRDDGSERNLVTGAHSSQSSASRETAAANSDGSAQVHVHPDQVHLHSGDSTSPRSNVLRAFSRNPENLVQGLFDNLVNETLEDTVTSLSRRQPQPLTAASDVTPAVRPRQRLADSPRSEPERATREASKNCGIATCDAEKVRSNLKYISSLRLRLLVTAFGGTVL